MKRRRIVAVGVAVALVAVSSGVLRADVRTEQKTRLEFAGMLGKFMNMFGGKGAREGVTSTLAIKGDRAAMMSENDGRIVDLAEEKVYELDLKKKTYKVVTFAELRRRIDEARKKAEEDAKKAEAKTTPEKPADKDQKQPQVEVDFSVKSTGEKKNVNGYDTQQQLMTITVREKGKTLDEAGGMVLTADMWIAPKIAVMKEVADFYRRYAQKVYGDAVLAGMPADQMATAMAMYPMMKDAISKMNVEGERVQGTPILTTITFEGVKSQEEMAQEAKQSDSDSSKKTPTSVGGLLGGFGKKIAAKKAGGGSDDAAKQRTTVMTSTTEYLKIVTDVGASDVAIPAGFKENK